MLDSGLPYDEDNNSNSYLKVSLPSTMSSFTVDGGCFAWALSEDLMAPTSSVSMIYGALSTVSSAHYITFGSSLLANTAYGL